MQPFSSAAAQRRKRILGGPRHLGFVMQKMSRVARELAVAIIVARNIKIKSPLCVRFYVNIAARNNISCLPINLSTSPTMRQRYHTLAIINHPRVLDSSSPSTGDLASHMTRYCLDFYLFSRFTGTVLASNFSRFLLVTHTCSRISLSGYIYRANVSPRRIFLSINNFSASMSVL